MKFPLGEMTVGDILDRGIKVLFARLPSFYLINLLVLWPVILLKIGVPILLQSDNQLDPQAGLATLGIALMALLLTLILMPIGNAAILHIIMEEYIGNKVTIVQAFSFAFSLLRLGASILVGLIIFVGTLLCCIPGIYFAISYAFVSQIVVLEQLGAGEALQRCWKLVNGQRWRVFGVLFLVGLASGVVEFTIGFALGYAMPAQEIIPAQNGIRVKFNTVNHIVVTLVSDLVSIIFTTFMAVCTTLLYLDIRIRKEGFDLELAALGDDGRLNDDDYDDRDRHEENPFDDDGNYRDRGR